MIASMADIASYRPNSHIQKERFRFWHVQALLNQAAELIDRCVEELHQYRTLDQAWHLFQISLKTDLDELALQQRRVTEGYHERAKVTGERRQRFFSDSQNDFNALIAEAQKLYNYGGANSEGNVGWTRHAVTNQQQRVELFARALEQDLTNLERDWANKDAAYYRDSLAVRLAAANKKADLSEGGKPLALAWQRDFVFSRLERNYRDALNRAEVAAIGLDSIYGYSADESVIPVESEPGEAAISHVANWIRDAIEWLVAYEQRDQAFSRVIALSGLLPKRPWRGEKGAAASVTFRLPESLFQLHDNVRLRGLSAFLTGGPGSIPWAVAMTVPRNAIYVRGKVAVPCPQSDMPACLLGRVEHNGSPRPPEVGGMVSLMNASPLGAPGATGVWSLTLHKPLGSSADFRDIDDILLELNCVGVPH